MLKLFSPAKINLFLRIVGKRPDGYHELSSLFQTIDLGDLIYFETQAQDELTCTDPSIPIDGANLVLKATQLFRQKTGLKSGLKIHLEKQIPIQAGLGGGSSNAATTLWAFNQLSGNIASVEELQSWSAEIGSDIPFFFSSGTAYCTGRGEKVQNLDPLSHRTCWIIKPSVGLSTPEVYKQYKQPANRNPPVNDLVYFFSNFNYYFNDLEKPALEVRPELKHFKEDLLDCGFETVLMTGSGSAFFCFGNGSPPPHMQAYSTQFINRASSHWYQ